MAFKQDVRVSKHMKLAFFTDERQKNVKIVDEHLAFMFCSKDCQ